jgi:BirA family biotin operon repressor/biotin-[acetyl-CoA-carboxylase] ligase
MAVSPFPLLRLLADGEFHSGRELGAALGLSRGAIWHRVRLAETTGTRVFKVRGRGYKLARPLDLLDARLLAARAARCSPPLSIEVMDECASTSSVLSERAGAGAPDGSVVACEHQAAGRGRRGNVWISPIGGSLAFSLLWRFNQGPAALAGLGLAVAVLAARALERLEISGVQVKWPNDLVCGGRKLGGILVEVSGEALGPSAVVIGVGLNVRLDPGARERIGRPVADLAGCSASVPARTAVLGALLESFAAGLARFGRDGFAPFRDEWMRRHAWQGRRVALTVAGRRVAEGEALGIAEDGSLVLRSPRGVERFHSGELSLRPA